MLPLPRLPSLLAFDIGAQTGHTAGLCSCASCSPPQAKPGLCLLYGIGWRCPWGLMGDDPPGAATLSSEAIAASLLPCAGGFCSWGYSSVRGVSQVRGNRAVKDPTSHFHHWASVRERCCHLPEIPTGAWDLHAAAPGVRGSAVLSVVLQLSPSLPLAWSS